MSPENETLATLIQVAQLYYIKNLSQHEIAQQLGVSRSLIALYLKRAREQNIVSVEIINPLDRCEDLALLLQKRTGISKVNVVQSSLNPALTLRAVGASVARYLENLVQDGNLVGLGWGRTIMEVVNQLAPSNPRQIEVIPLLGESSNTGSYTEMNQMVLQAARSFGGQPYFLLVPMVVETKELRIAILRDEAARMVTERWEKLDIACFGIGSLPPAQGQILYIGEENIRRFLEDEAVGDICARYYNLRGELIDSPINERLLGIQPRQLHNARIRIVAATGTDKAKAVLGGIRTDLITDLFIDDVLGRAILVELEN
jgi:DNA-binding transcriptional regulator LsrR (DeoR family)